MCPPIRAISCITSPSNGGTVFLFRICAACHTSFCKRDFRRHLRMRPLPSRINWLIRHATTIHSASVVSILFTPFSWISSILQPSFKIRKKVPISQRIRYPSITSTASIQYRHRFVRQPPPHYCFSTSGTPISSARMQLTRGTASLSFLNPTRAALISWMTSRAGRPAPPAVEG